MWNLTLYSKPGCTLCEEAKAAIREFSRECHVNLEEVDITNQPQLWEKYQFDIPVLMINGEEAARHHIGMTKLRSLHQRWSRMGRFHRAHPQGIPGRVFFF